jgi:hypothetical protein
MDRLLRANGHACPYNRCETLAEVEAVGHTPHGGSSYASLMTLVGHARAAAAAAEKRALEYEAPEGDVQRQRRCVALPCGSEKSNSS